MKMLTGSTGKRSRAPRRRTILCVDSDAAYASLLHDAWRQLHLADELRLARNRASALAFLRSLQGRNGHSPLAAVVLDPEATGEETGAFLRELRALCREQAIPIVFWSRDGEKYGLLEGRGVAAVLKKPMVLRLIQVLDATCQLRVQRFRPYAGNISFVDSPPAQYRRATATPDRPAVHGL
ncbi:MAG: hypothetical protein K9N49_09540 [Candidatus Marinimicrobia bacterium]|nr:hypothetical protein [Candidatus Neomarinimicrobiota bacterium]